MKKNLHTPAEQPSEENSYRKIQRWMLIGGVAMAGSVLLDYLSEPEITPWQAGRIVLAVYLIASSVKKPLHSKI